MRKKLLVELLIVIIFAGLGVYSTFFTEIHKGLDLKGGVYAVLEAEKEADANGNVAPITKSDMEKLIEVLNRRVNATGVSEARVQLSGTNRVIIEIPGVTDTEKAIDMIGKTALLKFELKEEDGTLTPTGLTGRDLKNADVTYDQFGAPQIAFELNSKGAKLFAEITKNNIGRQLAITLDGEIQSAPVIKSAIPSGSGSISGSYSIEEAKSFATLLNAGALPLKAEILETRSIGATLGADSVQKSYNAAKVAVLLIVLFMIIMYRVPGIIASIALVNFGILSFGILNWFDAVLTLPGIAGLILSLGMAVDANVIIFERIKEEMRAGQSIIKAVNSGFSKAFSAIMDSNITTLIMTTILYSLGTGPVRGFAVTLTIGTLASMFTAIVVTRLLLKGAVIFFGNISTKSFGVKGE